MTTVKCSEQIQSLLETKNIQFLALKPEIDHSSCCNTQNSIASDSDSYFTNKYQKDKNSLTRSNDFKIKRDALKSETHLQKCNFTPVSQCYDFHEYSEDKSTSVINNKKNDDLLSTVERYSDETLETESKNGKENCDQRPKFSSNLAVPSAFSGRARIVVNNANLNQFSERTNVGISAESMEHYASPSKQISENSKKNDNNQPIQMKTKLRSMWNNMKYGWRVKREVSLKVDSAAWLLGRCYHNKLSENSPLFQDVSKQLKLDLLSKIWLTYRINFPLIPGTDYISDSGWGCMLRCGQMMMAQALICHFLHRDWRVSSEQSEEEKKLYKMILRWFGDSLSDTSPFSLHHLVSLGEKYGRKAGNWYGPTHAAQVLRDALLLSQEYHPQLESIRMYVALDGIVFKQDIEDLCRGVSKNEALSTSDNEDCPTPFKFGDLKEEMFSPYEPVTASTGIRKDHGYNFEDTCPSYSEFGPPSFNTAQNCWKSLILFVSVRLGNDKINPFYVPCLKNLFTYEHCIGIIGGRPKHALYFIGWQDDKLIHMDPHSCQPAVDMEKEDFNEKTFHSSSIRTMSFSEMDPSCAIGFYFRKEEEYQHFVKHFSEITSSLKRNLDYPLFALVEGRRTDIEEIDSCDVYTRSSLLNKSNTSSKEEDDDYILL